MHINANSIVINIYILTNIVECSNTNILFTFGCLMMVWIIYSGVKINDNSAMMRWRRRDCTMVRWRWLDGGIVRWRWSDALSRKRYCVIAPSLYDKFKCQRSFSDMFSTVNVQKLYKCGNYELMLCIQLLPIFDYICWFRIFIFGQVIYRLTDQTSILTKYVYKRNKLETLTTVCFPWSDIYLYGQLQVYIVQARIQKIFPGGGVQP